MQVIYSFNFTQGANKNGVQINNISYKQYILLIVVEINNIYRSTIIYRYGKDTVKNNLFYKTPGQC